MPRNRTSHIVYRVDFSKAWQHAGCPTGYQIQKDTGMSRRTVKRYLPFIEVIDNTGEINRKRLEKYLKAFKGVDVADITGAVAEIAEYLGMDIQRQFSEIVTVMSDEIPELLPNTGQSVKSQPVLGATA